MISVSDSMNNKFSRKRVVCLTFRYDEIEKLATFSYIHFAFLWYVYGCPYWDRAHQLHLHAIVCGCLHRLNHQSGTSRAVRTSHRLFCTKYPSVDSFIGHLGRAATKLPILLNVWPTHYHFRLPTTSPMIRRKQAFTTDRSFRVTVVVTFHVLLLL